jgi:hypothetical protein
LGRVQDGGVEAEDGLFEEGRYIGFFKDEQGVSEAVQGDY